MRQFKYHPTKDEDAIVGEIVSDLLAGEEVQGVSSADYFIGAATDFTEELQEQLAEVPALAALITQAYAVSPLVGSMQEDSIYKCVAPLTRLFIAGAALSPGARSLMHTFVLECIRTGRIGIGTYEAESQAAHYDDLADTYADEARHEL